MKKRYHGRNVETYIIKFTLIYVICVSFILFFISKNYALSFIVGGSVNVICFRMTVRTVDRVVDSKGINAKGALIKNNISKMSIYLLVLVISGISQTKFNDMPAHLEIIPTAIGFLSVKIVIYFKYFMYDKIFKVTNYDDSLPKKKKKAINYKKEGVKDGENN